HRLKAANLVKAKSFEHSAYEDFISVISRFPEYTPLYELMGCFPPAPSPVQQTQSPEAHNGIDNVGPADDEDDDVSDEDEDPPGAQPAPGQGSRLTYTLPEPIRDLLKCLSSHVSPISSLLREEVIPVFSTLEHRGFLTPKELLILKQKAPVLHHVYVYVARSKQNAL
ncbi:hypothetical protein HK102_010294, partial [Quaeritorhiza haematococci]